MNSAIKKAAAAKIDVKTKLGKELATTLNHLQYDYFTEFNALFSEDARESFTELRMFLQ